MNLTDVCRHPIIAQYTFFSAAHGTFSKIDYILRHKASPRKYKKIEITLCILFVHNELKLQLNNKNNSRKCTNDWRLSNTLLNDQWVIEEIREEIKKCSWELNKRKHQDQNLWDITKAILRGNFIAMSAYIKNAERSQINDLMLHLNLIEK
jgi:hypothetical protein